MKWMRGLLVAWCLGVFLMVGFAVAGSSCGSMPPKAQSEKKKRGKKGKKPRRDPNEGKPEGHPPHEHWHPHPHEPSTHHHHPHPHPHLDGTDGHHHAY